MYGRSILRDCGDVAELSKVLVLPLEKLCKLLSCMDELTLLELEDVARAAADIALCPEFGNMHCVLHLQWRRYATDDFEVITEVRMCKKLP